MGHSFLASVVFFLHFGFPFTFILSVLHSMLPSRTIFLLAFWMCHSTVIWPPLFLMMSQPLIIMLVSYIPKVAFLLLFSRFFSPLALELCLDITFIIVDVSWQNSLCDFPTYSFVFIQLLCMAQYFSSNVRSFQVIISSNLFLPLSLSDSSRNHYL